MGSNAQGSQSVQGLVKKPGTSREMTLDARWPQQQQRMGVPHVQPCNGRSSHSEEEQDFSGESKRTCTVRSQLPL